MRERVRGGDYGSTSQGHDSFRQEDVHGGGRGESGGVPETRAEISQLWRERT